MDLSKFKMTEEKVRKLKPVIERILSRQYDKEIKFLSLTIGNITITDEESIFYNKKKAHHS